MREVHTVTVTAEAPWSNRTVDALRVNRDGTVWSDIVLPGSPGLHEPRRRIIAEPWPLELTAR
jgi:hypothetical protein